VVARTDIGLHGARDGPGRERFTRDHVIQAPADVALPHVSPRRPPGEQAFVQRIQRPPHIDEAAREKVLDERALLRQLTDGSRLSLFRMNIDLGPRDVHVPANHERSSFRLSRCGKVAQRLQEAHFGREVLSAVRNVDRRHRQPAELRGHDPVLVVEGRVREHRPRGKPLLAHVEAHARIAFLPVPVAPVTLQLAERGRNLIGGSLDLLQAHDVGPIPGNPLLNLLLPRADPVDVPRRDPQGRVEGRV
jgi:hypothetical protein